MHADPKDVVIAIIGAAVALAGLLLVFAGFLFGQAASFPPSTPDAITEKFTRKAKLAVVPFLGALLDAGIALGWMLNPTPCFYQSAIGGFIVLLVVTG